MQTVVYCVLNIDAVYYAICARRVYNWSCRINYQLQDAGISMGGRRNLSQKYDETGRKNEWRW